MTNTGVYITLCSTIFFVISFGCATTHKNYVALDKQWLEFQVPPHSRPDSNTIYLRMRQTVIIAGEENSPPVAFYFDRINDKQVAFIFRKARTFLDAESSFDAIDFVASDGVVAEWDGFDNSSIGLRYSFGTIDVSHADYAGVWVSYQPGSNILYPSCKPISQPFYFSNKLWNSFDDIEGFSLGDLVLMPERGE